MNSVDRYQLLARWAPDSVASIPDEFVLHDDPPLKVLWAPMDFVNTEARIVIVGITPGWQQAEIAYRSAAELLGQGLDYLDACKRGKAKAAFAGSMRTNLVSMLDGIGIPDALGIQTSGELFGSMHPDLHSTSALRYPVFRDGKNYTGHGPTPLKNAFLKSMVESLLVEELDAVSPALVVPLGKAAASCVEHAVKLASRPGLVVLESFPHPSGANGHRAKQYRANKSSLERAVAAWAMSVPQHR